MFLKSGRIFGTRRLALGFWVAAGGLGLGCDDGASEAALADALGADVAVAEDLGLVDAGDASVGPADAAAPWFPWNDGIFFEL